MRSALKINHINNRISGCSYSIILATETNWNEDIKSEEVFNSSFNVFRSDRDLSLSDKKSGGGVLVAVGVQHDSEQIITQKHAEFEDVWVKVLLKGEIHIFVSVYFPPHFAKKQSYEKFLRTVELVNDESHTNSKIHIYGDFNQNDADFIVNDDNESLLLPVVGENETLQFIFDGFSQLGLNQVNSIRNEQNCFLDFLFTNCTEDFSVDKAEYPLWKNEKFHTAIEYSLMIDTERSRPSDHEPEYKYDFTKANFELINRKLTDIDWQSLLKNEIDMNKAVDNFLSSLYSVLDSTVPKSKKKTVSSKDPIWFTREIKNLKNRKQKAHKTHKKLKDQRNLDKYLNICDELNTKISIAYENYNTRVENNIKSDPKQFFKFANDKMKSNNFPSRMQYEDFASTDSKQICNKFASFFQTVYKNSDEVRDFEYFSHLHEQINNVSIKQITVQEILATLKELDASKGPGPDGIPPSLMKNLAPAFVKPLFWLFNLSLTSGQFPSVWKKSFLIPIFKSGKRSDIKNYRGIAIISCIPKLFEAIVNQKIFNQVKNRITCNQHGFYKGRSTATNLLEFVDFSLASMDRGNFVETLYTDFSKAFDRVDISMLMFKLKKLGFESGLLRWIESYLTNRTQTVRFKGHLSVPVKVTSGVPQGSHLGPLLFILFVNDVTLVLNRLKVLIYADDMKLYMEIKHKSDIQQFQQEVDIFYIWCKKSLLDLNVKKCNIISYTRKRNPEHASCTLAHQVVERCYQIRDLGVIMDSKLTFIDHYNTIINRANSMLSFIKRFSYHFVDPYTIKTLFVTYVRSILEYCSVVWSPYQDVHSNRIESVQKQFLLYALRKLGWNSFPLPCYESRCMLINIETLEKRREIASVTLVNDLVSQRISSENLLGKLNFYAPTRSLRTRKIFVLNSYRTEYAMAGPVNSMMSLYNKYCEVIDLTMSRNALRKILNTRIT